MTNYTLNKKLLTECLAASGTQTTSLDIIPIVHVLIGFIFKIKNACLLFSSSLD